MNKEEILNVESFLKSMCPSTAIVYSITTFRNPDVSHKAPKFLTEIIFKDPQSGALYPHQQNSMLVLRMLREQQRKQRVTVDEQSS